VLATGTVFTGGAFSGRAALAAKVCFVRGNGGARQAEIRNKKYSGKQVFHHCVLIQANIDSSRKY